MTPRIQEDCPDEAVVLEFVQGGLEQTTARAVEGHLARCPECRELVSALARSSLVGIGAGLGASAPSGATVPLASSAGFIEARVSAKSEAVLPVREGDLVADKYRVDRVIGVGGMGVVVAATHVHLGQQVALKFLSPRACEEPGAVARFLREGRAAVRIQSEHVARVTDVGTFATARTPDAPYMVMEFLRGTDFAEVLRTRGPLLIADAVEFVLQACEAIAEAHTLGIVHRDLKPANLFLTSRADGSPLVKVLDFGISKATAGGGANAPGAFTTGEMVMGSPRYMSPEQMRSTRDVDARTDVWAMGVVLHELVTGRPAFEADTMAGLCALIATGAPTPLRAHRPNAPEVLERAIARCLEKDPRNRMRSIADLAEALAPVAPPSASVSLQRIARLMHGLGVAATVLDASPAFSTLPLHPTAGQPNTGHPTTGQPVGVATGSGFGRTASALSPPSVRVRGGAMRAMVTWALVATGLGIAAVGATFYVNRSPALAPSQAASAGASPVVVASIEPPAPPPPAAESAPVPAPIEARRPPSPMPTMTVAPAPLTAVLAKKASVTAVSAAPAVTPRPSAAPVASAAPAVPDPEADVHRRGLLDRK